MTDAHNRPAAPSEQTRRRMQAQARHSTEPEMAVRRELHRRGLRYRVGIRPDTGLRRTADIVFTRQRVAVYIDGCFWHACPIHGTLPKANRAWWKAKLEANVSRDRDTDRRLAASGWRVVRVWEHEDPTEAANRVEVAVAAGPPSVD